MLTELSAPRVTTDEVYKPVPKKRKYDESISPSVEPLDGSDDSDDSSDDEDPAREEVSSQEDNVKG